MSGHTLRIGGYELEKGATFTEKRGFTMEEGATATGIKKR
jgi:hypothetical protein